MNMQETTQNNDLFTEGQLTQEDLQAVVGGFLQGLDGILRPSDGLLAVGQFGASNAANSAANSASNIGRSAVDAVADTVELGGGLSQEVVGALRSLGL